MEEGYSGNAMMDNLIDNGLIDGASEEINGKTDQLMEMIWKTEGVSKWLSIHTACQIPNPKFEGSDKEELYPQRPRKSLSGCIRQKIRERIPSFPYHIDGDRIRDNGIQKCDHLLQNKTQGTVYLVELKGHALKTCAAADRKYGRKYCIRILKDCKVYYRIVYKSGTWQSVHDAKMMKWQEQFKPIDGRKKIIIKQMQLQETIS